MRKRLIWLLAGFSLIIVLLVIFLGFPERLADNYLPVPPDYSQLPAKMSKQIRKADKVAGRKNNSESAGQLGMVYHSNTFYEEAGKCYSAAIKMTPSDWIWYYYLGYLNSELGDPGNVIIYLKKAVELNPEAAYARYYLGEAYVNKGNIEEAERIFYELSTIKESGSANKKRSNLYPIKVYAKFRLARLYQSDSRLDSALITLQELTEEYPDYGPAFRLLSTVYTQLGKEELSNENLIRASELIPFTAPVDTLIDHLAMMSQSPEFLMKQIDITSISNPYFAKSLFDHAFPAMQDNQLLLSKGIKLYLNLGITENLTPMLNKHLKIFENDFNELYTIAKLSYQKGMLKLAAVYFEKCLKLEPQNFDSKYRLSLCYMKIEKADESIKILDELHKNNPDSVKVLTAKVTGLLNSGNEDNADLVMKEMDARFPDNPDVYYLKAKIALMEKNKKLSDEYFLKAYDGIYDNIEIIHYVGQIYKNEESWEKCISHYNNALQNLPVEPIILEQLGDLFLNCPEIKLRNAIKAEYYLERAFYSMKSALRTKISAGKNLAKVYSLNKKSDKALEAINMTLYMAKAGNQPDKDTEEIQNLYNTLSELQDRKPE